MRTARDTLPRLLFPLAALLLLLPPARGQDRSGDAFDTAESTTYVDAFDDEVNEALGKAARAAAEGDFEKAAALYQETAERAENQVVRVRPRTFLGVREYVKGRLRAWPPKGIEAYRKLTDSRAESLYRESIASGSSTGLTEISRRFVMSSHGPRALLALGTRALARGDADTALRHFLTILQIYPDGEIPGVGRADLLARSGVAAAKQGDRLLLEEIRALAAALPAGARVAVAGEERPLREALAALAARRPGELAPPGWTTMGGSGSRSGGREGPTEPLALYWVWQIPDCGTPTDEEENTPYSPLLPVHPLIAGDLVVVPGHRILKALRLPPADFVPTRASLIGLAPEEVFTYPPPALTEPDTENCRSGQPPAPATAARGLLLLPFRNVSPGSFDFSSRGRQTPLVSLSLEEEGKKLDQRGGDEVDDVNAKTFEGVEFCGAPLVVGDRLYTAGTRANEKDEEDESVETHVFCFDISAGPGRLRPLWSTFVCQGIGERAPSVWRRERVEASSLATRNGLIYAVSNIGAVAALDAVTGDLVWIHTYEQADPNPHLFSRETRPLRTWFPCPPMLDHRFLYAAPLDSDRLLVYHQRPPLESGLLLADDFGREDVEAGFDPEYLLGVRDGIAFVAGTSRNLAEPPLFAMKHGPTRPGDATRILWRAEIEEDAPRGRGVVAGDAVYFGTKKGIYRVAAADGAVTKLVDPSDDRIRGLAAGREVIGNLAVSGRFLVSASEELVCLFGPAPPPTPEEEEKEEPEKED